MEAYLAGADMTSAYPVAVPVTLDISRRDATESKAMTERLNGPIDDPASWATNIADADADAERSAPEAIPAAPLPRRGEVRIAEALPVVLDALAAVRQRDELRQLLPLLLDTDAAPYRQRLAELLGSVASRSTLHPVACTGARDATAHVAPQPETPRAAAGAAWSLNLTRGDARRWLTVWARHLPRWIYRAAALGVRHREWTDRDAFRGTRPELLAMGIVRAGDFPGDAGRGRSMVTFAHDGLPKRKGEGHKLRPAALQVLKSGRGFSVLVFAPAQIENARRRALGLPVAGDDECERERKPAAAAALRLVRSRGDFEP